MFRINIFPISCPVDSVYNFFTDSYLWLWFALDNVVDCIFFPFPFFFFWYNLISLERPSTYYVAGNNFEFLAFTSQVLVMESRDLRMLGNYQKSSSVCLLLKTIYILIQEYTNSVTTETSSEIKVYVPVCMCACVMYVLTVSQTWGHICVRQISTAEPWPPDAPQIPELGYQGIFPKDIKNRRTSQKVLSPANYNVKIIYHAALKRER